jgi:hypothetical protein
MPYAGEGGKTYSASRLHEKRPEAVLHHVPWRIALSGCSSTASVLNQPMPHTTISVLR